MDDDNHEMNLAVLRKLGRLADDGHGKSQGKARSATKADDPLVIADYLWWARISRLQRSRESYRLTLNYATTRLRTTENSVAAKATTGKHVPIQRAEREEKPAPA